MMKNSRTVTINRKKYPVSNYQPGKKVRESLSLVLADYVIGKQIMDNDYEEFNNQDLISRLNRLRRQYNSYQPPKSSDPDDAWKSNAKRPIVRNKIMSILAHITASLLYPNVHAQNDKQERDKLAALVAKDLMSWAGDQSGYERNIIFGILEGLIAPAWIMETGHREVYRTVKMLQGDGSYKDERILDEDYSGFYDDIVPVDELYIGNIYEFEIQKQPFLIRRKVMYYEAAARMFESGYSDFQYVRPGIRPIYSEENDVFYDQYDNELEEHLVEVVYYYNKRSDLELVICNGIMLSNPDQPIKRLDKKYKFAKGVYSLIDGGKFFYGKSKVDEMLNDADVIDTLYQMVIDGTYLEVMPYAVVFGEEEFHSSIVAPGKVTGLSQESKLQVGNLRHNLSAGMATQEKVEGSINETSTGPLQSGQTAVGDQTAYEISRLEQNAMTVLGLFGKEIGFFIRAYGELRLPDVLQFLTVGEMSEITENKLDYKTFTMPDRSMDGKSKSRRIEFTTEEFPAEGMTEEELLQKSLKLAEEEDKLDGDTEIWKVNPNLIRDLVYLVRIDATFTPVKNEAVTKGLKLEAYDRAIQNPHADQEALYRDFLLESYVPGEADKYVKKPEDTPPQGEQQDSIQRPGNSMVEDITGGIKSDAKEQLSIEKQL